MKHFDGMHSSGMYSGDGINISFLKRLLIGSELPLAHSLQLNPALARSLALSAKRVRPSRATVGPINTTCFFKGPRSTCFFSLLLLSIFYRYRRVAE